MGKYTAGCTSFYDIGQRVISINNSIRFIGQQILPVKPHLTDVEILDFSIS
jgi:hypothetical protein